MESQADLNTGCLQKHDHKLYQIKAGQRRSREVRSSLSDKRLRTVMGTQVLMHETDAKILQTEAAGTRTPLYVVGGAEAPDNLEELGSSLGSMA
ncbi:hypothetical protein WN943_002593 [Citrus x changshan-huyou]